MQAELFPEMPGGPLHPSSKRPRKTGYKGNPGQGPLNETCKTCAHYCRVEHGNKYYRKCGLMKAGWTNSGGTDILAKSPACQFFE
jgi:hypothetical protein